MKKIIGIILIITGIGVGAYLGLWVMFIGGIMAIAKAWDTATLTATFIAWNIIKIALASPVGYGIFAILTAIGELLIED